MKYVIYARKSEESEDRQVQSLEDQLKIANKIAGEKNLKVVKIFEESCSAKAPGRKVFNEMISYIQDEKNIQGILCWAMNRLTRNPVDTGTLQWIVQSGTIEKIITPSKTYTEVDSDFVMAIEGAQANRFILDLRKDTKRGLMSKVDKGVPPILAPAGYKNDKYAEKGKKKILIDQEQFPLVRKLFDLYMTSNYSVQQLHKEALRIGVRSRRNTKPIGRTQIYELLRNPFYMGRFKYAGNIYQGTYKPMILPEEHELVLSILTGKSKPKFRKHSLISGIIHCGKCGRLLTGEKKKKVQLNGNVHRYTYYICNGKRRGLCNQKSIKDDKLVKQASEQLADIRIDPEFMDWAVEVLHRQEKEELSQSANKQKSISKEIEGIQQRLHNLFQLKISPANTTGDLLADKEFLKEKKILNQELMLAQDRHKQSSEQYVDWIDTAHKMFKYACTIQDQFDDAPVHIKKCILKALGSNLIVDDGILEINMRKPFYSVKKANKATKFKLEPQKNTDLSTKSGMFDFNNSTVGG